MKPRRALPGVFAFPPQFAFNGYAPAVGLALHYEGGGSGEALAQWNAIARAGRLLIGAP